MKVTVTKNLNVRVGSPSVNAPCFKFLAPGSVLEVDGQKYKGDTVDGNNDWLKDGASNFYWTGGVLMPKELVERTISKDYDQFIREFQGDGEGIGIAFLDSGVNENHVFLKRRIGGYESFLEGKSKLNITSHGNRVAGILASDDPSVKRNKSTLFCFRVADQSNIVFNLGVEQALTEINNNFSDRIDIINLSLDVIHSFLKKLQPIIDQLHQKGIIVVVAAGENNFINNVALLNNTIKVSAFDDFKFTELKSKGLRSEYTVSFFNEPIPSYSLSGDFLDEPISQDSAYAAVVSALIAKHIAKQSVPKNSSRLSNIEGFIRNHASQITSSQFPQPFKMYI